MNEETAGEDRGTGRRSTNSKENRIGHQRVCQVFEYLKALNEHRNPAKRHIVEQPWRMWFEELPKHPSITWGSPPTEEDGAGDGSQPVEDFVLRVRRPTLTPAPAPPEILRPWLLPGWESPHNQDVQWRESIDAGELNSTHGPPEYELANKPNLAGSSNNARDERETGSNGEGEATGEGEVAATDKRDSTGENDARAEGDGTDELGATSEDGASNQDNATGNSSPSNDNHQVDGDENEIENFEDDLLRIEERDHWTAKRRQWQTNELPARQAMQIFEQLYELHGRIQREAERVDFVLGDGVLSWEREDGSIYHPVIIQRVQLLFDPKVPEFKIVDADFQVELYTALFQSIAEIQPQALADCRRELEEGNFHPLAKEASGFLRRFTLALSSQGDLCSTKPPAEAEHPTVGRAPVLFLRSRTLGFSTAIDRLLERLRTQTEFTIPIGLLNIVGEEKPAPLDDDTTDATPPSTSTTVPTEHDILFGKASNPEQTRIAQRLDVHGAVLVQGPPGTGKSHTIANLIGHLLAQGKSVLVTSHTTRALRVLRQHVVEELRPLCVSVLDRDLDSRRQLEESVNAISSRLSDSDEGALRHEASELAQSRVELITRLETCKGQLLDARRAEYEEIIFGGQSFAPSAAARIVAEGKGLHDWIPGPVAIGEPLPLSPGEVIELYATNAETTPEDDQRVDSLLPEADDIMTPTDFEEALQQSDDMLAQADGHKPEYWDGNRFTNDHLKRLTSLISDLEEAVGHIQHIQDSEPWKLAAVDAGRTGGADAAPWEHLLGKIEETGEISSEAKLGALQFAPVFTHAIPLEEQRQVAEAMHTYVSSGNHISWWKLLFRPTWQRNLKCWSVRGKRPKKAEQFSALERSLSLAIARDELSLLWDGLMAQHGVSPAHEFGQDLENVCLQYDSSIRQYLSWWQQTWEPLVEELKTLTFKWDRFLNDLPPSMEGELMQVMKGVAEQLLPMLTARRHLLRSNLLKTNLEDSSTKLSEYTRPEVKDLQQAIAASDPDDYQSAHATLVTAIRGQKHAQRRRELLDRLEAPRGDTRIAEPWATSIRNRIGKHGEGEVPGEVTLAWQWRQLNDELDRRARIDAEQLETQSEELTQSIADTTVDLIDRKAWAGQVKRTTTAQRQALIGWLDTIRRIGAGYGRRVPQLRMEARRLMSDCRDAVPVWIMPLSRLVENFDFARTKFDVVIIDEASQCDVMALLALAIAEQVIIVGDHEQVSPSAVGDKLDIVANLIDQHLSEGIPNRHLYDGKMSVYDLARQSFGGTICLLEHFRCVPDIIEFSNHLSYHGRIKPLRDETTSPLRPHVIPYQVKATQRVADVNELEARAVASLLAAAMEHEAYEGQSMGVISLVGDEQAMAIERMLRNHLPPEQFEARRIVCGNSAHFQGDERDVMFLSMVNVPSGGLLPIRRDQPTQQRFNVAASRARNQMWVVHSICPETDLQPDDLRRRLIEHARDPAALTRELERAEEHAESEFERQVIQRLVTAGYGVKPQWKVGRFRIDIVVEGEDRRLAIECDGDRYHSIDKLPEDMTRQSILERLGWKFHRIRGSEFFRDPDGTMQRVFEKLTELGIKPTKVKTETTPQENDVQAIIRRAAEIRAAWELDGSGDEATTTDDMGSETASQ